MARVLLYTGKGGVGKTSIAAATALRCSQRGLRTIVLSTDAAHSLGDSFDTRLSSPEPIEIAPRLWAQESDVYYNVEKYWGTVQRWIASVFAWDGVDEVLAEEMAVLPGMDELSSLLWILEHERSERFDAIIVDCAPTAEALRLLTLPDAGRWWVERIFPFGRRLTGIAQPIARRLTDLPLPGSEVFDASEEILRQVNRVQAILNDPEKTSVRLVINAEKMVISESQRTFTYLSLYNYRTDLVICNRMIPPGAADGYFDAWRAAQQRYLKLAEESFAPVPLRCVPFFDREVVGLEMLERVADELYGDDDPTTPLFQERPFTIEKVGDEYILEVSLPLASREEVSLLEAGEQLVIEVGPHRRTVMLPRMLLKQRALSADSTTANSGSHLEVAQMMSEAQKIEDLEERISALERDRSRGSRPLTDLRELLERLVPTEVRQHLRTSQREQVMAVRAYLDYIIERIDEEETTRERRAPRRVNVE